MKRQFYFDDVERDLLRCSLQRWREALIAERDAQYEKPKTGHKWAGRFTERRIGEILARLAEPLEKEGAA